MNGQSITSIIAEAVVSIIAILLGRYVIPWVKLKLATSWTMEAVKAAEQTHGEHSGSIKKEEVLSFLELQLKKYHINLTAKEIDTLIESAVKKLKMELEATASKAA